MPPSMPTSPPTWCCARTPATSDLNGEASMLVIDEYLALRVIGGDWPAELPDDELGLPVTRHWRLLQQVYAPAGGQLSQLLVELHASDHRAAKQVPRHAESLPPCHFPTS